MNRLAKIETLTSLVILAGLDFPSFTRPPCRAR
jgi:hypothetical protein